jgi:hypothetical protein
MLRLDCAWPLSAATLDYVLPVLFLQLRHEGRTKPHLRLGGDSSSSPRCCRTISPVRLHLGQVHHAPHVSVARTPTARDTRICIDNPASMCVCPPPLDRHCSPVFRFCTPSLRPGGPFATSAEVRKAAGCEGPTHAPSLTGSTFLMPLQGFVVRPPAPPVSRTPAWVVYQGVPAAGLGFCNRTHCCSAGSSACVLSSAAFHHTLVVNACDCFKKVCAKTGRVLRRPRQARCPAPSCVAKPRGKHGAVRVVCAGSSSGALPLAPGAPYLCALAVWQRKSTDARISASKPMLSPAIFVTSASVALGHLMWRVNVAAGAEGGGLGVRSIGARCS